MSHLLDADTKMYCMRTRQLIWNNDCRAFGARTRRKAKDYWDSISFGLNNNASKPR